MHEQDGSENTNWWNIGIGALAGVGVGIALAPVAVPAAAGVLGVGGAIWATTAITVGVISLTSGVGAYFASEADKQTNATSEQEAIKVREIAAEVQRAAEEAKTAAGNAASSATGAENAATRAEGAAAGAEAAAGNAAERAAAAADKQAKIRQDFANYSINEQSDLSTIYQYKVSMGLDILSDTSKNEATKIEELTKLMSIQSSGVTNEEKKQHYIDEFTAIDAKAPNGAIATDTPWPKALRVFAQEILSDASAEITDQNKILALEAYLKELKSRSSNVSSIQTKIQSGSILTFNSTQKLAGDFLKKILKVSEGTDGKKDISSIKAFDDAAAASIDTASADDAAAAVVAVRAARIREDFGKDLREDYAKFYETVYKYRLGAARDILESESDVEKINKLKELFSIRIRDVDFQQQKNDFVNQFAAFDFPVPDISNIAPLSHVNLRTFADAILDDKDVTPDVKIRALDSHIKELTIFRSEESIPNNDAFNFYKIPPTKENSSSVTNKLKAIATKFLNDFKSVGNTTTFELAYDNVAAAALAAGAGTDGGGGADGGGAPAPYPAPGDASASATAAAAAVADTGARPQSQLN